MAVVAACTDKGAKRRVNQDACCIQVANTPFGEMVLAVVCDGVGGLSVGELASATVAYRFAQWFRQELPTLLTGMNPKKPVDFDAIQLVWGVLLANLNETIQAYGRTHSQMLGTTFSGILICGGQYLVGHVGDCRVYQIGARGMRQVTEDQTLLAKKLAAGEITPQEAKSFNQKHVILQSIGTEGLLKPVFYRGTCTESDLFVMCCDGAYRKAEDAGIHTFFEGADRTSEEALNKACQDMLKYDLSHGEKDNLTVLAVVANNAVASVARTGKASTTLNVDNRANMAVEDDEYDTITMVQDAGEDEEDMPTMVEPMDDEEDMPTMVEPQSSDAAFNEEDLQTQVETTSAEPVADEEDLPTMVEPTAAEPMASEEDLPTMVEPQAAMLNEEDLPTMVEGDES